MLNRKVNAALDHRKWKISIVLIIFSLGSTTVAWGEELPEQIKQKALGNFSALNRSAMEGYRNSYAKQRSKSDWLHGVEELCIRWGHLPAGFKMFGVDQAEMQERIKNQLSRAGLRVVPAPESGEPPYSMLFLDVEGHYDSFMSGYLDFEVSLEFYTRAKSVENPAAHPIVVPVISTSIPYIASTTETPAIVPMLLERLVGDFCEIYRDANHAH